jgi:hypothetical protein
LAGNSGSSPTTPPASRAIRWCEVAWHSNGPVSIWSGFSHPIAWAHYPSVANPGGERHFERLIGRAGIRELLEQRPPDLNQRIHHWTRAAGWAERVTGCLLYT